MSADRFTQRAQIKATERRNALAELKELAVDIGRCQETITSVMVELNLVNAKYQGERSSRQEVEYLTMLLACAKKKLAWEKQIASLQNRAPQLLQRMSAIMTDPDYPPTEEVKAEMRQSLQNVQRALARLQPPETAE